VSKTTRRPRPSAGRKSISVATRAIAVALVAWAVAALVPLSAAAPTNEQPVAFNHNAHVEKVGIVCTKCHAGADKNQHAGVPTDVFCEACHSEPRTDSAVEAKLISMLENGEPLAWKKVTRLADYVYFSHRRHAGIGNVDCSTCHGPMNEHTVPITAPAVDFNFRPGMLRCIRCHQKSGSRYAHIDCVDCHR